MISEIRKDRPYLIHTNRELGLMLAGLKPLAVFADAKDHFPDVVVRYLRLFDKHVGIGALTRRDHFSPWGNGKKLTLHRILFALPGEEWRIDEMITLMSSNVWSRNHEKREGELLGYEDWLNDFHLQAMYPTQ